jgi:hypothetical protein
LTFPSFFFGLVVATFIGLGFHIWKNGGFFKIIINILLSWIGFFAGNFLGQQMDWEIWIIGPFHMGSAIFGSIMVLLLGHWLGSSQILKES